MKNKNLADMIEKFILNRILEESENFTLVKRNELAEKLACAPSQISYVISTRFTPERGYLVESRRGNGGFVKIEIEKPNEEKNPTAALIQRGGKKAIRGNITLREKVLLDLLMEVVTNTVGEHEKMSVLAEAMKRLAHVEYMKVNHG